MNNSLFFILFLLAGISCSEPEGNTELSEVYKAISAQNRLYYNVEYSIHKPKESAYSVYGTISLNRNSDSGISSAFFGINEEEKSSYMHSMYLNSSWIHDLSSNIFDIEFADLLSDSLHSPVLINPSVILDLEADSANLRKEQISDNLVRWTFNLKQKNDQMVLIWNDELRKLIELRYRYNLNSENTYSRKWVFEYMSESDFKQLEVGLRQMHEKEFQTYL